MITMRNNSHGGIIRVFKRQNTEMASTCDWMIKIVKVNKLYLNSLLVSIVNRVSQSGTMKYQCEWKHRCIKQEMVTYVAKGRQLFLFSEVVQRYSGDEKVMCWLNSFSQFRRTIRTGVIHYGRRAGIEKTTQIWAVSSETAFILHIET